MAVSSARARTSTPASSSDRMTALAWWAAIGRPPAAGAATSSLRAAFTASSASSSADSHATSPAPGSVTTARPSSGVRPSLPSHAAASASGSPAPPARTSPRMRTASAGVSSALTSASSTSAGGPADAQVLAEGLGQPLGQAVELEEVEQAADLVDVGVLAVEVVDGDADGHVDDELHELGVLPDARLVLGEVGAQLRRLLVEVLEDAVDAAVGGDELGRRLLAHARHARQVVGRVAPQRRVLEVEAGRHARALPRCPPRRRARSRTRRAGCRAP